MMKNKCFGAVVGVLLAVLVVATGLLYGRVQELSSELTKDTGKERELQELKDDMNDLEDRLAAAAKELETAKEDAKHAGEAAEAAEKQAKQARDALTLYKKKMNEYLGIEKDINIDIDWGGLFEGLFGNHEIWDNSAVVEAYLTGDASALTDEQDIFVLEAVTQYIDELITEDMTDYEKELAIYEWLVSYTVFDEENMSAIVQGDRYSHLPYGVLKYHMAICVGYATTFQLFMDCLEIPCKTIHSTITGEHAWNMVQLDGEWYHVDVTFDGGGEIPLYTYFNVPDEVVEENGYPWSRTEYPEAASYKYCYVVQSATDCADIYDLPRLVSEDLAEITKTGGTLVYRVDAKQQENAVLLLQRIAEQYNDENTYCEVGYVAEIEEKAYVRLSLYFYEELPSEEFFDIDMSRLEEELNRYFGK